MKRLLLSWGMTWLLLSVMSFALYCLLWYTVDADAYNLGGYLPKAILFDFCYCATFCLFNLLLCNFIYRVLAKKIVRMPIFVISSIIVVILNFVMAFLFEYAIYRPFYMWIDDKIQYAGFYILSLIAAIISVTILSYRHYRLYIEKHRQNKENEMALLKHQLDPHFIFNNLCTLDGLIDNRPEDAHLFLSLWSKFYRYLVNHIADDTVVVSEAIRFIRVYFAMMEVRFPKHFLVTIDERLDECNDEILPMSLQILVENAIKHNIHSGEHPIAISILYEDNYIIVRNTYRPNNINKDSARIGLKNLRSRYLFISQKDCYVEKRQGYFEVRIPIIEKRKNESTRYRR